MSLPFEISDVPEEMNKELWSANQGYDEKYILVGPKKYLYCMKFKDYANEFLNMPLREDDVWVVTFPRSGTTWTSEMAWIINNDLDYERAMREKFHTRVSHIDANVFISDSFVQQLIKLNNWQPEEGSKFMESLTPNKDRVQKIKSPRHIKTHSPLSLLPPKLLDTCKVIYVARNPKDVAVSRFNHSKSLKAVDYRGSFEQFWDLFQRDAVLWAPFWDHVLEAWELRNHPNLLFLFYEDMKKDLPSSVRKIAKFLNKPLTDDQIPKLIEYLKIESFQKNPTFTKEGGDTKGFRAPDVPGTFRQGKSGSWRNEFSKELNAKADEWIIEHEKRTDLRFQF